MGIYFGTCCISGVSEIAKGGVDSVGGYRESWELWREARAGKVDLRDIRKKLWLDYPNR